MIATLVATFARQRLAAPMRVALLSIFLFFGTMPVLLAGSLAMLGAVPFAPLVWVIAGGAIGQDVASGVLTLVLARPVRRWEYVIARWLGVSALATGAVLAQVGLAVLAVVLRHGALDGGLLAAKVVEGVTVAFGQAAVVVMFSSLVVGLGDLGLLLVANLSVMVGQQVAGARGIEWLARALAGLKFALDASVTPAMLHAGGAAPVASVAAWGATVAIALAVAISAMRRRELSYGVG